MNEMIGPKGFSLFDGYGVLVDGFNLRQSMNMSSYNFPYYQTLLEGIGLAKVTDFISVEFNTSTVVVPEKVTRFAPSQPPLTAHEPSATTAAAFSAASIRCS